MNAGDVHSSQNAVTFTSYSPPLITGAKAIIMSLRILERPFFLLTTLFAFVGAASAFLGAASASAQGVQNRDTARYNENSNRGYNYTGPYAQFGVAIGRIDFDDFAGNADVDSNASGGFTMTGGYRFLPWLAAELNFTFLGGKDNLEVGSFEGDTEAWAFTVGPKIYPLALFDVDALPQHIQPYGLIGIGGGEIEIEGGNSLVREEDSFIARFIIGFDYWATDNLGLFVEGGGFAIEEEDVDGAGIFTVGAQYRF